jgi:hypothetical protein
LQNDAPVGGAPHTPTVLPEGMVQVPVQQSAERAQMSPCWMQNDAASSHWPFVHRVEQHSLAAPQVLPAVLQLVLSAWHLPETHDWPQQSPSAAQA